jgi:hypothetical protein
VSDEPEIPLFTDVPPVVIALGQTPSNAAPELRPIAAVDFTSDAAEPLEPRRTI